MAALTAPLLVGGLAIGVDVAYWRHRQAQLQIAADAISLSLAIDIGNSIKTQSTLQTNGTAEGQKMSCSGTCAVAVTYPWNSDNTAVRVVVTDTSVSRFFSGIYDSGARTLSSAAVAATATTTTTSSGPLGGSGCILGLSTNGNGGRVIDFQGSTTVVEGCEILSNGTTSYSVFGDANARLNTRVTTAGGIQANNGSSVLTPRPYQASTPDPYYSRFGGSSNNPLRKGQFGSSYFAPNATQASCMETVISGNINGIDWSKDQRTGSGSGWLYNPARYNYSSSVASDGRRIHNLAGGGGVFCADQTFNNAIINFAPGVWYWLRDVNLQNTVFNATGTGYGSTGTWGAETAINTAIPSIGGATTNGTTLVLTDYNWGLRNTSEIHIRAPNMGPFSGVSIASYTDSGTNANIEFANSAIMEFGGVMYLPNRFVRIQNAGRFYSLAGKDNTAESGCSQMVAGYFAFLNDTTIRNNCAGWGLSPFGTDTTSGWYSSSSATSAPSGIGARIRN